MFCLFGHRRYLLPFYWTFSYVCTSTYTVTETCSEKFLCTGSQNPFRNETNRSGRAATVMITARLAKWTRGLWLREVRKRLEFAAAWHRRCSCIIQCAKFPQIAIHFSLRHFAVLRRTSYRNFVNSSTTNNTIASPPPPPLPHFPPSFKKGRYDQKIVFNIYS